MIKLDKKKKTLHLNRRKGQLYSLHLYQSWKSSPARFKYSCHVLWPVKFVSMHTPGYPKSDFDRWNDNFTILKYLDNNNNTTCLGICSVINVQVTLSQYD